MREFILWLMSVLGITANDLLLTGFALLIGAIFLALVVLFAWADRHGRK